MPSVVAERIIEFLTQHEPKYKWFTAWSAEEIRQQAATATERYQNGVPLSVLDGVPFAVKDSLDALPYPTTFGTTFMAGM